MAIGISDMILAMDDTLWFINPMTWLGYFIDFFIKWGIEALIEWFEHGAFKRE